jgi:hypothetical protein
MLFGRGLIVFFAEQEIKGDAHPDQHESEKNAGASGTVDHHAS